MTVKIIGIGGTNRSNSLSYTALEIALEYAQSLGAEVQGFKVYDLDLPMYDPTRPLSDHGENVKMMLDAVRDADGVLISSGSYHGILAGITKNAIDFFDFLDNDPRPYLNGRAVGLIATGAGELGATTTLNSLIDMAHALRGVVTPVTVPIGKAWDSFENGQLTDEATLSRLKLMTRETLQLAQKLSAQPVQS